MTIATVTPTRRPLGRRIVEAPQAAYLRRLIAWADQDAALHDWHAITEPKLAELARNRAAELRVQLARIA